MTHVYFLNLVLVRVFEERRVERRMERTVKQQISQDLVQRPWYDLRFWLMLQPRFAHIALLPFVQLFLFVNALPSPPFLAFSRTYMFSQDRCPQYYNTRGCITL